VHEDHRVVVRVDHACLTAVLPGDFMHVRAARQATANVEKLTDPGVAQESGCPRKELAVTTHGVQNLRHRPHHFLRGAPVSREVVLAAQAVVIDPGRVRDVCADIRRTPRRLPMDFFNLPQRQPVVPTTSSADSSALSLFTMSVTRTPRPATVGWPPFSHGSTTTSTLSYCGSSQSPTELQRRRSEAAGWRALAAGRYVPAATGQRGGSAA
jgi:hypothetical protein